MNIRPEIKIRIDKKGLLRFIPCGFDILNLKFLITAENNPEQNILLRLWYIRILSGEIGEVGAGKDFIDIFLKAEEKKSESMSLKLESSLYSFEAEVPHNRGSWGGYEIKGLKTFRVLDSRSLIVGVLIGTLISILLAYYKTLSEIVQSFLKETFSVILNIVICRKQ